MDPTEQEARQLLERLSRQEWEVFRRHCLGMSYAAIGRELYLGKSTVQNYMERAYDKLNLLEVHDKEERRRIIREVFAPALLSYPEPSALPEPEPERGLVPTSEAAKAMVRDDEGRAGPVVVYKPESRAIDTSRQGSKEIVVLPAKKVRRWPAFLGGVLLALLTVAGLGTWLFTSGQLQFAAAPLPPVEVTREVPFEVINIVERTVEVSTTPLPTYTPQPIPPPVIVVATATERLPATREPEQGRITGALLGVDTPVPDTATPEPEAVTPTPATDSFGLTLPFEEDFTDAFKPDWKVFSGRRIIQDQKLTSATPILEMELGTSQLKDYTVSFDLEGYLPAVQFGNLRYTEALEGNMWLRCYWYEWRDNDWRLIRQMPQCLDKSGTATFKLKDNRFSVEKNGNEISYIVLEDIEQRGPFRLTVTPQNTIDNFRLTVP